MVNIFTEWGRPIARSAREFSKIRRKGRRPIPVTELRGFGRQKQKVLYINALLMLY